MEQESDEPTVAFEVKGRRGTYRATASTALVCRRPDDFPPNDGMGHGAVKGEGEERFVDLAYGRQAGLEPVLAKRWPVFVFNKWPGDGDLLVLAGDDWLPASVGQP